MYLSEVIEKKFHKLAKKNKKQLSMIDKKLKEIISDPYHFKPLKGDMKGRRRVHIDSSFVLIFAIEGKKIIILDYDHHDNIY